VFRNTEILLVWLFAVFGFRQKLKIIS